MNFTAADRVGVVGGYVGGISTILGMLGGNGLGGIVAPNGNGGGGGGCSDNVPINRYEMGQQKELINAQAEIAYLRGRDAAKDDGLALYKYVDGQLKEVREALCAQAVHNQRTEDSFLLVRQDVAAVRNDLHKEIELEAERRCCADGKIVGYVNGTFYPKLVADVTAGTTTTAQTLYNPLTCGSACC